VELLVVIAIISILAGMLLPALENAIEEARVISCMNVHKQTYLALTFYTDAYEGTCPPSAVSHGIGLHYLYRAHNNEPGFCQAGRLWKDGYLEDLNLLIDPDWPGATFGPNSYGSIVVDGEVRFDRVTGAKDPAVGTYVFYGFQGSGNAWRINRTLEPLQFYDMSALYMCRLSGYQYFAPLDRLAHNGEPANCTYVDGHVSSLNGSSDHWAAISPTIRGNHWIYLGNSPQTWWVWATRQDGG
jgi:prepilin-type processing-associated H-X9-DG protein